MTYRDGTMDDRTPEEVTAEARARLAAQGVRVKTNPRYDTHDHTYGAERCPSCGRHDHADTTPYGYTVLTHRGEKVNPKTESYIEREYRLPVPAWHFTCLACRGALDHLEGVALTCDVWTREGLRFRQANRELFPGQLPLVMDDEHLSEGAF